MVFALVREKLEEADYGHAVLVEGDQVYLDMHGIALVAGGELVTSHGDPSEDIGAVLRAAVGLLPEAPDDRLLREVRELHARDAAVFETVFGHGCFTGDCPHEIANDCVAALREHVEQVVRERTRRSQVLETFAREVVTAWDDHSEYHRPAVLEPLIEGVRKTLAVESAALESQIDWLEEVAKRRDDGGGS